MIVNAAGPWIDDVNNRMGKQTNYIGGTKGSHIIVKNPELKKAIGNKEFFFENKDGRIVLLLPFFDKVIIGTSDLPIDDPDGAVCTPEEEAYFIDLVKRVFPEIPILPEQIVFRFSGVRPLEYQHAKTTGQITRDHTIKEDRLGNIPVLNLVGGKWTSYRAFGEQAGEKALDYLSQHRKGTTEEMKIGGGRDYPPTDLAIQAYLDVFSTKGFEKGIVETLFERYGSTINEIIGTGTIEFLKSNPLITVNEINFLARTEKVVHLDDLLLRRTSLGWLGLIDEDCLREISMLVGAVLGWSTDKKQNEIERVKALFLKNHGVTI
jgi:glycerol-3-phosphate dehydrogenase